MSVLCLARCAARRSPGWCLAVALSAVSAAASTDLRLVDAVRTQNAAVTRALLDAKVDVTTREADGATALHWAAHWNDAATAERLIRAGAGVNVRNELGVAPLHLACENGNGVMVEMLLRAGADANAALPSGETPLMTAAMTGSVDATRALLAHGADAHAREGSRGQTALMWAAANRRAAVVRVLTEGGADVQARSRVTRQIVHTGDRFARQDDVRGVAEVESGGFSALIFSARSGDVESARLLLAAGAKANDAGADRTSALVLAAHSGHGSLAALLLEKGADANAAGSGYTALHAAVLRGDAELAKALLHHGADPNVRLTKGTPVARYSKDFSLGVSLLGATPYLLAAKFAEPGLMQVLASGGADPKIAMPDGTTALMFAAGMGWGGTALQNRREQRVDAAETSAMTRTQDELASLAAVTVAAELGGDVNAVNREGDTALHAAASKKLADVIRYLAGKGAVLDVKNRRGQTPLSLAAGRGGDDDESSDKSVQDVLRKLGATQ